MEPAFAFVFAVGGSVGSRNIVPIKCIGMDLRIGILLAYKRPTRLASNADLSPLTRARDGQNLRTNARERVQRRLQRHEEKHNV